METATLAKVTALRRIGIAASVLFSDFYGDGARAFASREGVIVGLRDERAVTELLNSGFDAISVIDYPDFGDLAARCEPHVPILFETYCGVPNALDRFYRHLNHERVKAIVVPSQYNKRLVGERVNPSCDIIIVPNAVDETVFRPGKPRSNWIRQHVFDGEKIILWVGRLEDDKNPGELIQIAEQLLDRMGKLRFLIVGDLPDLYEDRRTQLLDTMSSSTRRAFTFLRTVPNEAMPDLYRFVRQTGGALISTSLHELLPMTFLEAMACGCPILSTDVGGVRDIILDGSTGRLYPAGHADRAVNVLQELLSLDYSRSIEDMTRRARRQVVRDHSLQAVARQYEHLLDWLERQRQGMPGGTGQSLINLSKIGR